MKLPLPGMLKVYKKICYLYNKLYKLLYLKRFPEFRLLATITHVSFIIVLFLELI